MSTSYNAHTSKITRRRSIHTWPHKRDQLVLLYSHIPGHFTVVIPKWSSHPRPKDQTCQNQRPGCDLAGRRAEWGSTWVPGGEGAREEKAWWSRRLSSCRNRGGAEQGGHRRGKEGEKETQPTISDPFSYLLEYRYSSYVRPPKLVFLV